MAEKEKSKEKKEESQALGPSVVLGLIGAIVVLVLLGAGIWGVSRVVTKIRENGEETQEEEVAETEEGEQEEGEQEDGEEETEEESETEEDGDQEGEEQQDEGGQKEEEAEEGDEGTEEEQQADGEQQDEEVQDTEEETESEDETQEEGDGEEATTQAEGPWVVNNYKEGDIEGGEYTVVRGDTLWEIAEARYGSGFEWGKILEENLDKVGYLPNGSRALIIPGQVLSLPKM